MKSTLDRNGYLQVAGTSTFYTYMLMNGYGYHRICSCRYSNSLYFNLH